MHKIILLLILSFFSLSSASNSVQLEIHKMKANAKFKKESHKSDNQIIKGVSAILFAIVAGKAYVTAMDEGGLAATELMQQKIGDLSLAAYVTLGFAAIELGIIIYGVMKGMDAYYHYQTAQDALKDKETLIALINNKKQKTLAI